MRFPRFSLVFMVIVMSIGGVAAQNPFETGFLYTSNRPPLLPAPYTELPLGAIRAQGWLLEQLKTQAQGLTGHLDEVYEEVCGPRNGWLGGDGDGWERGPYWLDGLVPLAYILNDPQLIEKAKSWIEWSLNNTAQDGYFGPVPFDTPPPPEPGLQKDKRRDWWPKMVMLKVLQQYHSATDDPRVLDLMRNYFRYQLEHLPATPIGHWTFWGQRRGGENLASIYWLYNRTGDDFLLELAELVYRQTMPWTDIFIRRDLASNNPPADYHCVNMAMAVKLPLIYYQQHPEEKYLHAVKLCLNDLRVFHGQVQGMYGADEPMHGNNPTCGSELCSAVELAFSLESILKIAPDVAFADHLEKIIYNALPAQIDEKFTTRQYYQMANQVQIRRQNYNFITENGTRLVYGVLTGYPCCTCNMHQGWPKFVQNLWYATEDGGLAALVYGPSEVTAKVAGGQTVHFEEKTHYPFDEKIEFSIDCEQPVLFPLHLRIPGWCKQAVLKINDRQWQTPKGNRIVEIRRIWQDGDRIELYLPQNITTSVWYERSVGIERGPLVYALKIDEDWKHVKSTDLYGDYYEVYPASPWNFGLPESFVQEPEKHFEVKSGPAPVKPWNPANAPVFLETCGKQMPHWKLYNGTAGPIPTSPDDSVKDTEPVPITLIPYGCTTLRIAQFPVVR
ncbi:glycoside hydrolase family 127 protein [candidate division KSB1 bacterium]|nr:glycoside hydrolase family 127 protein [candidate division KSB1 bacterium]